MPIPELQVTDCSNQHLLTFTSAFNARITTVTAQLTTHEVEQLRKVLDQLLGIGSVAAHDIQRGAEHVHGLAGVFAALRRDLGDLTVHAAIGAAAYPGTPTPAPLATLPLWCFETSEQGDIEAYGLLFGRSVRFEALRVEGEDEPIPSPQSASRFRSLAALLGHHEPGTVCLPGFDGSYVVFAASQAG